MAVSASTQASSGSKRLFDQRADALNLYTSPLSKRNRPSAPESLLSQASSASYQKSPDVLRALCALFPGMDDKAVAAVLDACNEDVDTAIRRLNEMRLSGSQDGASAAAPGSREGLKPSSPSAAAPSPQRSADDWVSQIVQEMAAAKDVEDARQRAAAFLQQFEQCVQTNTKASHAGGKQLLEAQKANLILKKAVAIQNSRLQELGAKDQALTAENQHLSGVVSQQQERIKTLELANYSLKLHLRQAADASGAFGAPMNPDVF